MPDYTADQMYAAAKENGTEYGGMDTMPDIVGLGLWKQGHWGVYVGSGYAIEAMGTQYGVVRTKVEGCGWQGWCKIPYIQYDDYPYLFCSQGNSCIESLLFLLQTSCDTSM